MDIYFCKTKLFGKQIEGANSDLITDAKVLLKNFPIKQKKDHFFAQNINQRDMLIFQHIFFLFPLFKILNTSFPLKFFKSENGKFHSNHNKAFCWEKKKRQVNSKKKWNSYQPTHSSRQQIAATQGKANSTYDETHKISLAFLQFGK